MKFWYTNINSEISCTVLRYAPSSVVQQFRDESILGTMAMALCRVRIRSKNSKMTVSVFFRGPCSPFSRLFRVVAGTSSTNQKFLGKTELVLRHQALQASSDPQVVECSQDETSEWAQSRLCDQRKHQPEVPSTILDTFDIAVGIDCWLSLQKGTSLLAAYTRVVASPHFWYDTFSYSRHSWTVLPLSIPSFPSSSDLKELIKSQ